MAERYLETGPRLGNAGVKTQSTAFDAKSKDALDAGALHPAVDALAGADRAAAIDRRARISAATRKLIEEGLQDGSFASVDSKLASLFVLRVVNWILIWYRPNGDRTRDEIVDAFIGMIENGLTPRPRKQS